MAGVAQAIAGASVFVGSLVLAPIVLEASFVRISAAALHADEEELVWHLSSASRLTLLDCSVYVHQVRHALCASMLDDLI